MSDYQLPSVEQLSPLERVRAMTPAFDKMSDYQLLKTLYDKSGTKSSLDDFAKNLGIDGFSQREEGGTFANSAINSATLGLADPAVSAVRAAPTGGQNDFSHSDFAKWLDTHLGTGFTGPSNADISAPGVSGVDPAALKRNYDQTFSDAYNQNRQTQEMEKEQGQTDNPWTSAAGNVAGLMAGLGPIGKATDLGVGALRGGRTYGGLTKAAVDNAVQGAGEGGVNSYQNGDDAEEIAYKSLIGGGLGAGATILGDAAVQGANLAGKGITAGSQAYQDIMEAIASLPRAALDALAEKAPAFKNIAETGSKVDTALSSLVPDSFKRLANPVTKTEGGTAGFASDMLGLPGTQLLFHSGGLFEPSAFGYIGGTLGKAVGNTISDITDPKGIGYGVGQLAGKLGYDASATADATSGLLTGIDRSGAQDFLQGEVGNNRNPTNQIPQQALTDPQGFVQTISQYNPQAADKLKSALGTSQDAYKMALFSLMNSQNGRDLYSGSYYGGQIGKITGLLDGTLYGGAIGGSFGGIPGASLGAPVGAIGGMIAGKSLGSGIQQAGNYISSAVGDALDTSASATKDALTTAKNSPQQFLSSLSKVHPQLAQALGQAYQQNPDKYAAMLFTSSQNPEYRQALITAHSTLQGTTPQGSHLK